MRVAVAGAGTFGRNHLRVVRELENAGAGVALVAAVEPDAARAAEAEKQYGIKVFASADELLNADLKLHAACVVVPTAAHHDMAAALLEAGLDLLVEKPLAANLKEADDLIAHAKRRGRIVQPGHLERFNPAVLAVEPKLKRPMFFEAHRLSVFMPRALDVDVVLDLMIHDLDIVLTFAKSAVREVRAVGLPILSPKVDIANVRVEFDTGCVANFTASRVSTERVRKLRFFEPRQYVSIDYARRDVLVIRVDEAGTSGAGESEAGASKAEAAAGGENDNSGSRLMAMAMAAMTGDKADAALLSMMTMEGKFGAKAELAPGMSFLRPEVVPGEPLRLEIESFLESVRTRRAPQVTAQQGRAALELALEIQAAMAAHAERAGLVDFFKS